MEKRIKVLHLVLDDKFIDSHRVLWDCLEGVDNNYLLIVKNKKDYVFKYIKNLNNLDVCDKRDDFLKILLAGQYDVVFCCSLDSIFYKYVNIIPARIKIICWFWGYDIYDAKGILKPLVQLNLYKEETLRYISKHRKKFYFLRKLYWCLRYCYDCYIRDKAIKRVDYVSPVLPIEYSYLKKNRLFKADLFFSIYLRYYYTGEFKYFQKSGDVWFGNSATTTNNHLDIIKKLKMIGLVTQRKQTIIMPLVYGDVPYATYLKHNILSGEKQFKILDTFVPYKEYCNLVESCSHAIFGVIRQQAIGNIFICLRSGVKLFLYKDSMVYEFLKQEGYIVYTIDEDLTEEGLNIPLSKEEAMHNYNLYKSKVPHENYATALLLSELKRILN